MTDDAPVPGLRRIGDLHGVYAADETAAAHAIVERLVADGRLYPTRHCFDDAVAYIEMIAREDAARAIQFVLVHGVFRLTARNAATPAEIGARVAHAWVEEGDLVWDNAVTADGHRVTFAVDRAEYYREMAVERDTCAHYTMPEMLGQHRRHRTTGPWRADLRALTR